MQRTKPPFRADHVGSFLRPAALKEARAKRDKGAITPAELKAVENREIEKIIKKQEEVGLKLATDGEFRRSWWHFDFFGMLDGVEVYDTDHGIQFQGVQTKAAEPAHRGQGRLLQPSDAGALQVSQGSYQRHAEDDHSGAAGAAFPAGQGRRQARASIPTSTAFSRSRAGLQAGGEGVLRRRLPLSAVRRHGLGLSLLAGGDSARRASGCRTSISSRTSTRASINAALEGKPADMTITTHVCRGNFRSTWISEAATSRWRRRCSGRSNYDGYFLEYDTERAGGFEPLRFLPKGNKIVVLGLVTSKSGTLEKKDDIKRRIDEAAKFAAAGAVLPVAAMRLRLDRGGQRPRRGGAMGEASHDQGARR